MRAMCFRDLVLISRTRSLSCATALLVVVSAAFLLSWGDVAAVPFVPGVNLYEQHRTIQWALLSIVVPWVVCRFVGEERGDACARLSVLTGVPPSRLLMGRLLALAVYLALLIAAAFPLVLFVQQMSAIPARLAAADAVLLFLFAMVGAALTMHVALWVRARLGAWLLATAAVVTLRAAAAPVLQGAPVAALAVIALCAVAAAVVLSQRADRRLWYLEEPRG